MYRGLAAPGRWARNVNGVDEMVSQMVRTLTRRESRPMEVDMTR